MALWVPQDGQIFSGAVRLRSLHEDTAGDLLGSIDTVIPRRRPVAGHGVFELRRDQVLRAALWTHSLEWFRQASTSTPASWRERNHSIDWTLVTELAVESAGRLCRRGTAADQVRVCFIDTGPGQTLPGRPVSRPYTAENCGRFRPPGRLDARRNKEFIRNKSPFDQVARLFS